MSHLFILLTMLLCACGGRTYQSSDYVSTKFKEDHLAVVIFKLRGKSSIFGAAPKVSFDLVKMDKELDIPDGEHIYHFSPGFFDKFNVWEKGYLCLMVEPGFYIIDNISWTEGNTNYYTRKELPTSAPVQYGAFEVKSGTVNYIGDLEIYCRQASLKINITNQFEEAKIALKKKHPELASNLVQADFFPSGYSTFTKIEN